VYDASRDAEDARLLEAQAYGELFAAYYPDVLARLKLRLPDEEAREVTQRVFLHVLEELRRGKEYRHPFRVIVHMRTTWILKEYWAEQGRRPGELPEQSADPAPDPFEHVDADFDLEIALSKLPEGERRVAALRWQSGMEIQDIAEKLGMTRNAVDQALFRAHRRLRGIYD
jgi:RNA polymerase sigma factor (sigma-70 family)